MYKRHLLLQSILVGLCVFTAASGAWLCLMENILRHDRYQARTLMDGEIVALSLLTMAFLFGWSQRGLPWIVALGGAAALYLGASAITHTFLALHFEGYVIMIGTALVAQGAMTLAAVGRLLKVQQQR